MKTAFAALTRSQRAVVMLVALAVYVVPLLILLGLGLYYLWQNSWLLAYLVGSALITGLAGVVVYLLRSDKQDSSGVAVDIAHLPPPAEWPPHDLQVWQRSMDRIREEKLDETPWTGMRDAAIQHLKFVADTYHETGTHAAYRFTIPELLLLIETCSARYRAYVLENVPMVNEIKVSEAIIWTSRSKKWYSFYDRYKHFINVGRAVISPANTVVANIRSRILGELFEHLSSRAQRNLKCSLLEHLTETAIDLYSGRLHLSQAEFAAYAAHKAASTQEAPVSPLRILVMGQVNAGKSTLINQLCEKSAAEIDSLPATDDFRAYRLNFSDDLEVDLLDSPGLDGSPEVEKVLLKQAINADLLLWVCQANQPAKSLDKALADKWLGHFETTLHRKRPPILLVTTHNDRLLPNQPWAPPYDVTDASDATGMIMLDAHNYSREAIGLDPKTTVIPVACPPNDAPYNIDVLEQAIIAAAEEARSVQLNRQRAEAGKVSAMRTLKQTTGALNQGIDLLLKRNPG